MKIKKDDNIIVLTGKDKGKTGKVLRAFPREDKVIIDGINMKKHHRRATREGQKGQVIDVAHPIHVSNIRKTDAEPAKKSAAKRKLQQVNNIHHEDRSRKNSTAFDTLKGNFGFTNVMQAPKVVKIIVTSGIGSQKDKKKIELIGNRLSKITGQKAAVRGAKQSISNFKIRQGDPVGYQITLRGKRMHDFLDRLLNVALPRTRDFRGISPRSIDAMGNYTFGIKEHTIFPETSDEDIKDVFSLAVTVVTSSNDKALTKAYLEHIGFPFKKFETVDVEIPELRKKEDKKKKKGSE